nr:DUF6610 family protein [Haloarcula sp. CBA1127]
MLGDAYDRQEARRYNQAGRELKRKFPGTEVIIVPKCHEAIDVIDEDMILGYPWGILTRLPTSTRTSWTGEDGECIYWGKSDKTVSSD